MMANTVHEQDGDDQHELVVDVQRFPGDWRDWFGKIEFVFGAGQTGHEGDDRQQAFQ
jgi:hypothetical protein